MPGPRRARAPRAVYSAAAGMVDAGGSKGLTVLPPVPSITSTKKRYPDVSLRHLPHRIALALPILALSSCAFTKQSTGLDQVDKVVERVAAVSDACDQSNLSVHDTYEWLRAIVAKDFGGDAITAYKEFAEAVELSKKNSRILAARTDAMERAADSYFENWAKEQWNFTSAEMRSRSQKRMTDARARYDAILAALRPAIAAYDNFNVAMHDITLFIGHDFTVAGELQREVRGLARQSTEIQASFESAIEAAEAYIGTTAVPIVRETEEETAPEPVNDAPRRGNR